MVEQNLPTRRESHEGFHEWLSMVLGGVEGCELGAQFKMTTYRAVVNRELPTSELFRGLHALLKQWQPEADTAIEENRLVVRFPRSDVSFWVGISDHVFVVGESSSDNLTDPRVSWVRCEKDADYSQWYMKKPDRKA